MVTPGAAASPPPWGCPAELGFQKWLPMVSPPCFDLYFTATRGWMPEPQADVPFRPCDLPTRAVRAPPGWAGVARRSGDTGLSGVTAALGGGCLVACGPEATCEGLSLVTGQGQAWQMKASLDYGESEMSLIPARCSVSTFSSRKQMLFLFLKIKSVCKRLI